MNCTHGACSRETRFLVRPFDGMGQGVLARPCRTHLGRVVWELNREVQVTPYHPPPPLVDLPSPSRRTRRMLRRRAAR